jgi:hypothetical protein
MPEKEPMNRYSDAECETLFVSLFPAGFGGKDVLEEISPEGWVNSALLVVFHPTVEQVHAERIQFRRSLESWPRLRKERTTEPEPTLEEIVEGYKDTPVDTTREVQEPVAVCLWDVFSNENDVVDGNGRLVDIGSWRGAAGFLADALNCQTGKAKYDYIDFYMGSWWVCERADLTPVYEVIFCRMKGSELDWRYRFPQMQVIEFPSDRPDGRRSHALLNMRADLERANLAGIQDLKRKPVPSLVLAYCNIYGGFPHGWPPWEFVR